MYPVNPDSISVGPWQDLKFSTFAFVTLFSDVAGAIFKFKREDEFDDSSVTCATGNLGISFFKSCIRKIPGEYSVISGKTFGSNALTSFRYG